MIAPRQGFPRHLVVMSLLLSIALLLGACSIGGDDDDDASEPPDATAETTQTVSTDAPTPTAAQAEDLPATVAPTEAGSPATPDASPATTPSAGTGDPPVTIITVGDVLSDPEAYIDDPVTLNADVAERVSNVAFTVTDPDAGEPLLVVGGPGVIPVDLESGAYVRVAGFVREFELPDIELAIGAGLDEDTFAEYVGDPVLVANEVRIGLVSVDDLLGNPAEYEDRRVTVTGPVGDVLSPWSFTLESRNGDGAVLVAAPFRAVSPDLAADKWVRATGTIQPLDETNDAFDNPDLGFLFEDDTYAAYAGEPVVVLDLLEVLSEDTTTTTAEIVANPAAFGGETVIVSDGVEAILAPQVFTMRANDQTILVVGREGTIPADLTAGAVVLVEGVVNTFATTGTDAIVWQALGVNTADPALAAFAGQPAIIAGSVDLVAVASGP